MPHFLKLGILESSKSTTTTRGATFVMTVTSARTKQTSYVTNYPTLEHPATPTPLILSGVCMLMAVNIFNEYMCIIFVIISVHTWQYCQCF